jgi:hypothetical protein
VKSFNTAVIDGDWSPVVASFHPDAVLEFAGAEGGPFQGRAAIAAAYAANPPGDTIRIRAVSARGDTDLITFAWSHGGTGTMEIERTDGLIGHLLVRFD